MFSKKQLFRATALGILLASTSVYATVPAPTGREGKVEWVRTQEIAAPAYTIDFTYSLDGKYAFFLTSAQQVQVYTRGGRLEGFVPVDAGVDSIDIAPQGEVLYLHNNNKQVTTTLAIDFVVDIDVTGSPFKGKVDAPVIVAVFTDFE